MFFGFEKQMTEKKCRLNSTLSDVTFKSTCENVLPKVQRVDQSIIDNVLSYDKPDSAEIVLPDGTKFYWYLAIGSMMNPISLYLRDLIPLVSYPAICPDYQLIFRGMADIEHCPGTQFHGVVHLLSEDQMTRLDKLEMGYNRLAVNSIDYQNKSRLVSVYQMKFTNSPISLPNERYLDIMVKGGEYYKVQSEYLEQLKEQQDIIPRKQPNTFQSFVDVPTDVFFNEEELAKHNGSDPSLPIWICINGKVLEYNSTLADDHPYAERQKQMLSFLKTHLAGREVVPLIAKNLYEPMYELPTDGSNLCEQQRAQIEDELYGRVITEWTKNNWKAIGRLRA